MGRNNMEREFRQKLESREIQPGANAWDRLDAMLSVAEEKKQKPVFKLNWLYIAAGFIGILLMATIFFKQSQKQLPPENSVVIENKQPPVEQGNSTKIIQPVLKNESPILNEAVAETGNDQKPVNNNNEKVLAPKQEMEFEKTNEAVVQSNQKMPSAETQKPTIKSTEVNVDELLASVDPKKANIQKPSIKVDAGSLLSQVDGEIELSFREKVIRTVSKNYKNVKVALANRNQE